jgi:quinol-cytochrome oxidoreductase complex cytochrome b subunit
MAANLFLQTWRSAALCFFLQCITGVLLMMVYEPSARPAMRDSGNRVIMLEITTNVRVKVQKNLPAMTYTKGSISFAEYDTASRSPILPFDTLRAHSRIITHALTQEILSPSNAYYSTEQEITRSSDFGWLLRGVHRSCSHLYIFLLSFGIFLGILTKKYLHIPLLYWCCGVAMIVFALSSGITGYILPFDTRGLAALEILISGLDSTPLLGKSLAGILAGARHISSSSLVRIFALHVAVLPLCALCCWYFFFKYFAQKQSHNSSVSLRKTSLILSEWVIITCVVMFCSILGAGLFSEAMFRPNLPADLLQPSIHAAHHAPEWYLFPVYLLLKFLPSSTIAGVLVIACGVVCSLPYSRVMNALLQKICFIIATLLTGAWLLASLYGIIVTAPFAHVGITDEAREVLIVSGILTLVCTASLLAFRKTLSSLDT